MKVTCFKCGNHFEEPLTVAHYYRYESYTVIILNTKLYLCSCGNEEVYIPDENKLKEFILYLKKEGILTSCMVHYISGKWERKNVQ